MDHLHNSDTPAENRKFPAKTLLIAIVVLAAAAAILVFNVPWTTVLIFGFFGWMMFGHFFTRGSHEGQAQGAQPDDAHVHSNQFGSPASGHERADGPAQPADKPKKDDGSHQGHSGCC